MCSVPGREEALVPPHGLTNPLEMHLVINFYEKQSTVKSQILSFKDITNIDSSQTDLNRQDSVSTIKS